MRPRSLELKALPIWAVMMLVLISFGLALSSVRVKSATFDEEAYIGEGIAIWKEGNYWLQTNHPALGPIIGTVFLLTEPRLNAPTDHACWPNGTARSCGRELLFYRSNTNRVLFLARVPTLFLMVLMVALVSRWTTELYGRRAAVLSAALCAFDPNLLANGQLLTLDFATALSVLLSSWALYHFWMRPGWGRLAVAGLSLGMAGSTRFTTGFLIPIYLAFSLVQVRQPVWKGQFRGLAALSLVKRAFASIVLVTAMGGIAAVTIWLIHGADFGPVPRWNGTCLPAPAYFDELARLLQHYSVPQDAFLLGVHYKGGWWPYFIVAFLVKTPLPTLAAIALASASTVRRHISLHFGDAVLLATGGGYFCLALLSPLNTGYRLLLPMLPPLLVFAGRSAMLGTLPHRLRCLPMALVGWLMVANLIIYPDYLAYFNELVGPSNGYRVLVDSNLDWGQDLPALERYISEHNISQIYLSWFGESRPWQYRIPYRAIPSKPDDLTDLFTRVYHPDYPPPGVYAISATNLQALLFDNKELFAWFLDQEPVAQPGYSILIYEVPRLLDPDAPTVTVALGGIQVDQVPPTAFETLWHTNDLRLRWFLPATSCILPSEPEVWYVLRDGIFPSWCPLWEQTDAVTRMPERDGTEQIVFYRLKAASTERAGWIGTISASSLLFLSNEMTFVPSEAPDLRQAILPPVRFSDRLELLGYRTLTPTIQPGEEWAMVTYWRVVTDDGTPLKIFVQVLDDSGNVRCQYDGLDVPTIGWHTGDLLVQHHPVPIAGDIEPGRYWVQLGVYDSRTMARLPITVNDEMVGTQLLLPSVEVH